MADESIKRYACRCALVVLMGMACLSLIHAPGLWKQQRGIRGLTPTLYPNEGLYSHEQPPMDMEVSQQQLLTTPDNFAQQSSSYGEPNGYADILNKVPLLQTLGKAGVTVEDETILNKLPTWPEIEEQYGSRPVITGLETCDAFRRDNEGDVGIEIGGLYSTGVELLDKLLKKNCDIPIGRNKYNAPLAQNSVQVLTVKDPFHWIHDMCRNRYKNVSDCTNLAHRSDSPRLDEVNLDTDRLPGKVFEETNISYDSLVDMWNKWYERYLVTSQPHLIIRYEDILFHGEHVVKTVCNCAGGKSTPFNYAGEQNRFLFRLMVNYGKAISRIGDFSVDELAHARRALNLDLMKAFRYSHPHFRSMEP